MPAAKRRPCRPLPIARPLCYTPLGTLPKPDAAQLAPQNPRPRARARAPTQLTQPAREHTRDGKAYVRTARAREGRVTIGGKTRWDSLQGEKSVLH